MVGRVAPAPKHLPRALAALPSAACVLWTGALDRRGYGRQRVGQRRIMAHRVVWELLVGPIPDGATLDHLCRTPACVNPAHLEPVSQRENVLRGEAPAAQNARKETCDRGHRFDYTNSRGERICRRCRTLRRKAWAARVADDVGEHR